SSSNEFGFQRSKKDMGYDIAASLMFAALRNNDNVGLCLFTDRVEKFIPPGKGKKHMLKLLRELIYFVPKNKTTNIQVALTYLNNIIKRRSIIFIISDFLSTDFERPLKQLKNKHDVILVDISDVREEDIPDIGYVFLEDSETGEQMLVDTSDLEFRKRYTALANRRSDDRLSRMKRLNVDMIRMNTSEPFYIPLQQFFKMRDRRRGVVR
ncbi:MAG: VWA domain-containing protein, partial [Euryarchaeota archaeon]|nr:VWA domain-containing protein [Euryarchaeota archaeon]